MEEPGLDTQSKQDRFKPWMIWLGLIIALLVAGCAVLALFLFTPRLAEIPPWMEEIAEGALISPGSAPIDLGGDPAYEWYPPDKRDFAVEDGMVIFPYVPPPRSVDEVFSNLMPDKIMPALVYAPDGNSLPSGANPPDLGRNWYVIGEWYLYDCTVVDDHPFWWRCMLVVGGNI